MRLRLVILFAYLVVAILSFWRQSYAPAFMLVMSLVTAFSLASRLLIGRRLTLPLIWEAGFLTIIALEFSGTSLGVSLDFSVSAYQRALQMLVLGHALVVVTADLASTLREPELGPRPGITTDRASVPVVFFVTALALVDLVPTAIRSSQGGRAATFSDSGPLGALAGSAGMLAPTLIAVAVQRRGFSHPILTTYLLSSPIIVSQLIIGTRYVLLFSVLAPLILLLGPRLSSSKVVFGYALSAAVLVLSSAFMLILRGGGAGWQQLMESGERPSLSIEGVTTSAARLVDYFDSHGHLLGASAGSVMVFAVPRAIWPDKPTLLGYWFPREYGLTGFSQYHSVSFGYVGDGYADLGVFGVIVYCTLIGILIGRGQQFSDRAFSHGGDAAKAFAAILFPAVYFAVRSPVTTMIGLVGVAVLLGVLRLFSVREVIRRDLNNGTRQPADVPSRQDR